MAESEEEPKNILMKVKEKSGKAGLKLTVQKTKIMASSPFTSWHADGDCGILQDQGSNLCPLHWQADS